ncbi:hypothetical protein [uncultured Reyranella sp.]|jgi:hypothetical protein|uniref:hypothetical protein n=1 Tax=uncultured Reyranella sp. TaxID=735512 RepID=UPI00259D19F7|nr:hypothetical protein [uncultured Reyranella sp.]
MSDNRDGNPSAQWIFGNPVQREEPARGPTYVDHGRAQWVTVNSDEAREMAEAQERNNTGRAQAEAIGRAIDASQRRADLSRMVPPGTRDPQAYINAMVAKAEAVEGSPVLDSSRVSASFTPPRAPTFQTKQGMPRVGATATADDLVLIDIGGHMTGVEIPQALTMGLIRQSPGGGYEGLAPAGDRMIRAEDVENAIRETKARIAGELEAKRASGDEPDGDTQSAINFVGSIMPGNVQEAFVNDYVENGTLSLAQLSRAAESAGIPPERALATAETVVAGLKRQAVAAVATQGIAPEDAEAAFQWMQDNYPSEHKFAAMALIKGSETTGLKALANKYRLYRQQRS